MISPVLHTERLELRLWREEEAPRLLDYLRRPEVVEWISDDRQNPDTIQTLDQARERLLRGHTRTQTPPYVQLAIVPKATGVPAGTVLLLEMPNCPEDETDVEIGWTLHPDSVGNGFVTEAAERVLQHGFEAGLSQIHAIMYDDNTPSAAVARRLGMVDLGIVEKWYPGESRLFRITREQYWHSRGSQARDDATH